MQKLLLKCCGALAFTSLMLSACTKQDATAPSNGNKGEATVNYELTAVNPTGTIQADAAGAQRLAAITGNAELARVPSPLRFDLTWDTAWVRFRELRFSAKRGPDEVDLRIKTDRTINILDSIANLGNISLPLGTYQYVKLYLRAEGDKDKPAVWLIGRLTYQGKDIPLEIKLAGKIELKASGKDIVVDSSGVDWTGRLKVDMNLVLAKLQIGDFDGSFLNGKIVISIDMNKDGNNRIKTGLENSMSVEHGKD